MIRSIFDLEESPEERKNSVDKDEANTDSLTLNSPMEIIPERSGLQQTPPVESLPALSVEPEKQVIESVKEAEFTVDMDSVSEFPDVSPVQLSQLESVVEVGEDFLELENEIEKIEEEVRLEDQSSFEIPANPFIEKSAPEQQPGIFTAALQRDQNEKQLSAPIEDQSIGASNSNPSAEVFESDNSGIILPNGDKLVDGNQGFILPNRIEANDDQSNIVEYKPESKAEIIRQSGLAWSAGIAFFASVVFLLIIGWFVDLLVGTSPWGAVGGIIVGSVIGFVQLFRLTSQILKNTGQE